MKQKTNAQCRKSIMPKAVFLKKLIKLINSKNDKGDISTELTDIKKKNRYYEKIYNN